MFIAIIKSLLLQVMLYVIPVPLQASNSNFYFTEIVMCSSCNDLVNKANSWLRQNPQVLVKSCETIQWTTISPIQLGNTETVAIDRCHCQSSQETYYTTGIRLWLIPKDSYYTENNVGNVANSVQNDAHSCSYSHRYEFRALCFEDFQSKDKETLQEFVSRINSLLDKEWIKGDIICISSLFTPDLPDWNSQRLLWTENQVSTGKSRLYLRVFYRQGEAVKTTIGIKDITPNQSQDNWDSFSTLMKTATNWIRQQTSNYVTNLQSIYIDRKNYDAKQSAEYCCQSFRNFNAQQCFQVLRLYYLKKWNVPDSQVQKQHVINCMTFTPVQTTLGPNTEADFERMKQTMSRICAWLELAGAVIRSAETFTTPVLLSCANHTLPETTFWTPSMYNNNKHQPLQKHLMHIRVYLEGDFCDPDPRLLPPLPYSLTEALQTSIQEREYKKYYKQKKTRRKRRKITVLVFLVILLVSVGCILLDQLFNIFRRFS